MISRKNILISNKRLSEIGEMALLNDLIFPLLEESSGMKNVLGDDCAILSFKSKNKLIVWTIDPTPIPVSWLIGIRSYYTYGWYSIAINLSDLASMGAKPHGILLSIETPNTMIVSELLEFIKGANDCCKEYGLNIIGGNIKDSSGFSCTASAFGLVESKKVLRRRGAKDGDLIVSIGDLGLFWSSVFLIQNSIKINSKYRKKFHNALNKPMPKVLEGQIIAEHDLVNCCIDNSDSVISCCIELAFQNNRNFILTLQEKDINSYYKRIFKESGVNPLSAACSWGDWNLICTVSASKLNKLKELLKPFDTNVVKIGEVSGKGKMAYYKHNGKLKPLNRKICSERFSKSSYFSEGIKYYINILKNENIWKEI